MNAQGGTFFPSKESKRGSPVKRPTEGSFGSNKDRPLGSVSPGSFFLFFLICDLLKVPFFSQKSD